MLEARFEKKIERIPEAGCWIWTAGVTKFGYGMYPISKQNRWELAHRVSWKAHRGEIPDGMCVLHHCDVPACVNPAHLFIGTLADNNLDKTKKGRNHKRTFGSACPKGHPYPESLATNSSGKQYCKLCNRDRATAFRAAVKSRSSDY